MCPSISSCAVGSSRLKFQASAASLRNDFLRLVIRRGLQQRFGHQRDHVGNFATPRRIDPNLHAGLAGLQPGGHRLQPCSTDGTGDGAPAAFLRAFEQPEVIGGDDVVVAAFAAPGFERAQNPRGARRRVRRPLDVEWFVVFAEHKLLIAVRRCDAAENAARLLVIDARRKPEPSGVADRILGQLARCRRRHSHRVLAAEEPIEKAFLVIGNTVEPVKARVLHTQAKHVEQKKACLNTPIGFKPAHYKIAAAGIEKFGRTQRFGRMFHARLKYKM